MLRRWMPVWCLLAVFVAAPAGACGLQVDLLYTAERLDGPPASTPVLSRVESDAATPAVRVPLPRRPTGHWLRLACRRGLAAQDGWQLVVTGARGLGGLTFYPPGAPPQRVARMDTSGADAAERPAWRGGSLALPNGWPASHIAYLHADGTSAEPLRLRLVRADALARERHGDVARALAAAALLFAFALALGVLQLRFRDRALLGYAAYLAGLAACVLLIGGGAAATFPALSGQGPGALWGAATVAAAARLASARRMLELDRIAPTLATLVQTLAWLPFVLLGALLTGGASVHALYAAAGSALLLIGAVAMPGLALLAWRRGGKRAGACLAGWTPMSVAVVSIAGDRLGLMAAPGAERWLPLAAVFEAVVLALALGRAAAVRVRAARRMRRERDALTGALGAHAFERRLGAWCAPGTFALEHRCLLLLAVDDFAALNARHGPPVGDAVLRQVYARLRTQLRPGDTVARVEEGFAVVGACARDGAPLARRLADAVAAMPLRIDGQTLVVTASVGVAAPRRGEMAAQLMQRARLALARARSLGRNAVSTAAVSGSAPRPALASP